MKQIPAHPVIYACAGCSGAGQVAYAIAIRLDKERVAEMSCLAGIASGQKTFLNKIRKRPVWVIDGCPIECGKKIFQNSQLDIEKHINLHNLGIKKNIDLELIDLKIIAEQVKEELQKKMIIS